MSSIKLESNASGTGVFTIASPNSNTNRTLTLPDQTGTVLTGSGAIGVNASAPTNSVAIDSSGNVGIGTSSPSYKLHVSGAGNQTAAVASSSSNAVLRLTSSGGFDQIIEYTTVSTAGLAIKDATAGLNRAYIDNNGNITFRNNLSVGNATPTTSGTGITFPATQSASTNANTLDDYEEGTWTPNSGGTATYTTQNGTYTKVGNKVTAHFVLEVNTIGTGSASNILGFPFTASSSAGSQSGHMSYATGLSSNQIFIGGYISANSTTFTTTSSGAAANSVTTNNIITSGTLLIGDITYFI